MADEWVADDRLDELLWGADLSASLQALERARGLVLGASEPHASVPVPSSAAASAKPAMSQWGKADEGAHASPSSAEERLQTPAASVATAATPLVSSSWLNWENPLAATKISPGLPEDTQELRRQKTRDAMRRSRQRQRDQLQQLRDAVGDLEKQYAQMCLVTERDLAVSHRSTDLADAVALSKRLGAENLMLKASIQRQEAWRQQLNVVMESRAYNNPNSASSRITAAVAGITDSPSSSAGQNANPQSLPFRPEILDPLEAKSVFGFRPLTEEDVKDVILANTSIVKRVQRQLLLGRSGSGGGHGEEDVLDKPVAKMDVLGWDVRQRVRGSHMEFVFTKRFHDVSMSEVMHKSWVGEMHLKGMQKVKYDTQRLEILQEVSPNAYVLGREVLSPDSTPRFRTTLVRYRMESPPEPVAPSDADDNQTELVSSGYVIGIYSINPDAGGSQSAASYARELSGDVLWADLSYSIEFRSITDAHTGIEQYVEVRWSGSTNYKSQFHAYRNTADKISTLLHWEMLHIGSVAQIIPTSPRGGR